jgi:hypothetical protein
MSAPLGPGDHRCAGDTPGARPESGGGGPRVPLAAMRSRPSSAILSPRGRRNWSTAALRPSRPFSVIGISGSALADDPPVAVEGLQARMEALEALARATVASSSLAAGAQQSKHSPRQLGKRRRVRRMLQLEPGPEPEPQQPEHKPKPTQGRGATAPEPSGFAPAHGSVAMQKPPGPCSSAEKYLCGKLSQQHERRGVKEPVIVWVLSAFQRGCPSATPPQHALPSSAACLVSTAGLAEVLQSLGAPRLPSKMARLLAMRYAAPFSGMTTTESGAGSAYVDYRKFVFALFPPVHKIGGGNECNGDHWGGASQLFRLVKRGVNNDKLRLMKVIHCCIHGCGPSLSIRILCDVFACFRICVCEETLQGCFASCVRNGIVAGVDALVESIWADKVHRNSNKFSSRHRVSGTVAMEAPHDPVKKTQRRQGTLEHAWARQVSCRFELTWAMSKLPQAGKSRVPSQLVGAATSSLVKVWTTADKIMARGQYFASMLASQASSVMSAATPLSALTRTLQQHRCDSRSFEKLLPRHSNSELMDQMSKALSRGRHFCTDRNHRSWDNVHQEVIQKLQAPPRKTVQHASAVLTESSHRSDVTLPLKKSAQLSAASAGSTELATTATDPHDSTPLVVTDCSSDASARNLLTSLQSTAPKFSGLLEFLELTDASVCNAIFNRLPWQFLRKIRAVSKRFARVAVNALDSRPQLVVAGGGYAGTALASVFAYDIVTKLWCALPSMISARNNVGFCGLSSGRLIAVGGLDNAGNVLKTAEAFDPRVGKWQLTAPLAIERGGCRSCATATGNVMVTGGYTAKHETLASVEEYDAVTDSWTSRPPMLTARYDHCICLLQSSSGGAKILVAGGTDSRQLLLQSAEVYDQATWAWSALPKMSIQRDQCAACPLDSNTVMVVGGSQSQQSRNNSSETAQSVTPTGPASVSRALRHSTKHKLESCESFSLCSMLWQSMPAMTRQRSHCSTCSLDGCVFVVGGEGGQDGNRTAEVYVPKATTSNEPTRELFGQPFTTDSWTCLPKMPMGGERYGCGCATVTMRPATRAWSSDEKTVLASGGELICWRTRTAALLQIEVGMQSSLVPIGKRAYTESGLAMVRMSITSWMLQDGSTIDHGKPQRQKVVSVHQPSVGPAGKTLSTEFLSSEPPQENSRIRFCAVAN